MPNKLESLTRPELDILLEGYVKAGVAIPEGLTIKPKIVAFLKDTIANVGTTHVVTSDDLKENPTLTEDGIAEGDTIIIPPTTPETSTPPVETTTPANENVDSVAVQYIDPIIGLTSRVFSREIHGDDFQVVADTFVESNLKIGAVKL